MSLFHFHCWEDIGFEGGIATAEIVQRCKKCGKWRKWRLG